MQKFKAGKLKNALKLNEDNNNSSILIKKSNFLTIQDEIRTDKNNQRTKSGFLNSVRKNNAFPSLGQIKSFKKTKSTNMKSPKSKKKDLPLTNPQKQSNP